MQSNLRTQRTILIATFLALPVFLSIVFIIYPAIDLFRTSLTSWNGATKDRAFIGFANYATVFLRSPEIWIALKNNLLYFVAHGVIIPLQLLIAVILNNKRLKMREFFKATVFLPYIINGVAISYMFSYFFGPVNGALNGILQRLGMDWAIQRWLSDPAIVNFTLVFVSLWRYFGFGVILYYSALQSIPSDIIEAAQIDGATGWHTFWKIYLPSVSRISQVLVFLNIRGALQVFDIPFVMTNGGPVHASSTFTLVTIETAFKFSGFGLASAMAVVMMVMIVALSLIQQKAFGEEGKL